MGCGAPYVGETSQSLRGRFRSHSFKIRNNSRRKYKNFLYDHFIKYNHSIENVTITPVEILSKQHGDSKNDMKKRRLSAKLNWIKRLQRPVNLMFDLELIATENRPTPFETIWLLYTPCEFRQKSRQRKYKQREEKSCQILARERFTAGLPYPGIFYVYALSVVSGFDGVYLRYDF